MHNIKTKYCHKTIVVKNNNFTVFNYSYISRISKNGGDSTVIGPKRFSRLNGITGYKYSEILRGTVNSFII